MTDQVDELTLRGTSTGWRKGLSETPPLSVNGRRNSSSWAGMVALHARGQLDEKQLGREGSGGPDGCQADHGPEICLCGKDGQWDPELL